MSLRGNNDDKIWVLVMGFVVLLRSEFIIHKRQQNEEEKVGLD